MREKYEYQLQDDQNSEYKYTTDRYALYLRKKIGAGIETKAQNNSQNQEKFGKADKISDEWVQLYKCIYIKTVALAEKSGDDLYLKIGEFWLVIIAIQLIASLVVVTGPNINLFFYYRLTYFSIFYLVYFPFLYWTLLNTRFEHVHKPWAVFMRLCFGLPKIANFSFILLNCPAFNSQIITFVFFVCALNLQLYAEQLVSTDANAQQKIKHALIKSSIAFDFISSILFFVKLILVSRKPIYFVFFSFLILGQIPDILDEIASNNFLRFRVQVLGVVFLFKFLKLITLLMILSELIISGGSTGGFGLLQLVISNIHLLLLVYRICVVSTENLLEKIYRSESE
eukprot:TRINITY_DN10151_c1_g1_i1.p1 TRINITY_DN10151_c1_g1~~TRINITY_DN10151_c1_g1_i1.p1  ORF type:complete len:341 (+),score=7.36 TRINITY_DN10151_c1_g1_i1:373-1395(+)